MGNVASSVLGPTTLRRLRVREPQAPAARHSGRRCRADLSKCRPERGDGIEGFALNMEVQRMERADAVRDGVPAEIVDAEAARLQRTRRCRPVIQPQFVPRAIPQLHGHEKRILARDGRRQPVVLDVAPDLADGDLAFAQVLMRNAGASGERSIARGMALRPSWIVGVALALWHEADATWRDGSPASKAPAPDHVSLWIPSKHELGWWPPSA